MPIPADITTPEATVTDLIWEKITVDGVEITLCNLVWNDGVRTYDLYDANEEHLLSEGSFLTRPTNDELARAAHKVGH